jgi:hypothetical protein
MSKTKARESRDYGFGYDSSFSIGMSKREHAICTNLPHGSGIDYNWRVKRLKNGKLVLRNEVRVMDEWGYYVGSLPFSITIDANDPTSFRLTFNYLTSSGYRWVERLALRDYLEDTFMWTIRDALEKGDK